MKNNLQEDELINLYAKGEEELQQLYHLFSQIFPDRDFWSHLSVEESIHKDWILSLYQTGEQVHIQKEQVRVDLLNNIINNIEDLKKIYKKKKLAEALNITLALENTMIEKNYFAIFETDSESVKKILNQLMEATKIHIQKVEEELVIHNF